MLFTLTCTQAKKYVIIITILSSIPFVLLHYTGYQFPSQWDGGRRTSPAGAASTSVSHSLINFSGSVVLYRGFRQAAPRDVRNITVAEFQATAEQLEPHYGNVIVTRLRRQSKDTVLFVKKNPSDFQHFAEDICSEEQYRAKFNSPLHATVTENVKSTLIREAHVTAAFFN